MENLLLRNDQLSLCDQEVVQQEEATCWSEQDIHELRYGMLITAIKEMRDGRKSEAMRDEARKWFFDDESPSPFSAIVCAKHTGYDIEVLRRMILRLIPLL